MDALEAFFRIMNTAGDGYIQAALFKRLQKFIPIFGRTVVGHLARFGLDRVLEFFDLGLLGGVIKIPLGDGALLGSTA